MTALRLYVLELNQPNAKQAEQRAQTVWFVPGHSNGYVSSQMLVVGVDAATRKVRWNRNVFNMGNDATWEALGDADVVYLRLIDRVVAIDKKSGGLRWVVASDANESSGNARRYLSWTATADTFVLDTAHRVDSGNPQRRTKLEIDMASGKRVYRTLPRPSVEPRSAYCCPRSKPSRPARRT